MPDSYEAVIPRVSRDLFQDALLRHMAGLGFDHMSIGGRLGGHSSHEFKKGDDLVSMILSSGGESDLLVVIHSSGIDVENLVLDALTEAMADLLTLLSADLTDHDVERKLNSLIGELRGAFEQAPEETG